VRGGGGWDEIREGYRKRKRDRESASEEEKENSNSPWLKLREFKKSPSHDGNWRNEEDREPHHHRKSGFICPEKYNISLKKEKSKELYSCGTENMRGDLNSGGEAEKGRP